MDINQINMWAVLLATLAKFFLGWLWYSPLLFAHLWQQEVGKAKESVLSSPRNMGLSLLLGFVTAITLAVIIALADLKGIRAMALGGLIGIGLFAAVLGPQYASEGRSFRLFAIQTGQYIAELILMAAIIGAWASI